MDYTEMEEMMQEMLQDPMYQKVFMITFVVVCCVMLVAWVVFYLLQAIGVRKLSATAGLAHPGLAFVPILRWMMLGRLAELRLPQERGSRKVLAYSTHLPVLMTLSFILNAAYSVYYAVYMFILPDAVPANNLMNVMNGVSIAYSVINLIATVLLLMALYRIFLLIGTSSPMLLTILCALVDPCTSILLFAFRKNEVAPQPISGGGSDGGDNGDDSGFYYDHQ